MLTITPISTNQNNINCNYKKTNFKAAAANRTLNKATAVTALGALSAYFISKLENYYTKTDKNGWNRVHHYCAEGNVKKVEFVLNHYPNLDINKRTKDGKSYIDCALKLPRLYYPQNEDICELIVSHPKYNPNIVNEKGETDADKLLYKYPEVILTTINKHPEFDINHKYMGGYIVRALVFKDENRDLISKYAELIHTIITSPNYNPNATDEIGNTDIHYLCSLIKDSNINAKGLIETILKKHPKFYINLRNNDSENCADVAKKQGHDDIVELLNDFANKTGVFAPANLES